MDGEGQLNYPKDDLFTRVFYKGAFKDEKKSGKGKFVFKDGSKYEGDFKNNVFHGFGVYTFSKQDEADHHEGNWIDGKMSGKGKLCFKNGSMYEGDFEKGDFHGFGVFYFSKEDGRSLCKGNWRDGKMFLGTGQLIYKNGDITQY
jgi:hypothetical protein